MKKDHENEDMIKIPDHDSAIVSFVYDYDLGRKGLFDNVKLLLSSIQNNQKNERKYVNLQQLMKMKMKESEGD